MLLLAFLACSSEAPDPSSQAPVPAPVPASVPAGPAPAVVSVEPRLVPLPAVHWEDFPPALRQKLRPIYELAERSPDDPESVGRLGMVFAAYQDFERARVCYQRARALMPNDFRWTYYNANAEAELGRHAEAVALLKAALDLSSDYGPAMIRLADLQMESGQTQTSETQTSEILYRRALELDPKLARAHYGLGRLLLARGDIAGAAERYRRASELEKNFRQAHYALGLAYRRLGESDKAKASLARYEQLRDQPEPSFDPVADAVGELAGGRRAAAGPSLDLPKSALEQAAAELEVALEKQPWLLSAHANLIGVYWELKKPEKAAEHYRAALKIDSEDATIHYNWAVMQNLSGDLPAAEKAFRRALGINPEYADAHVQYGALLERMDKQAEAVRHYRRAIGINPNDRRGNLRIGLLHVQAGRLGEAIPHLEKTILVDDRQSPIYMRILAGAHGQSGNHQRALALLREARKRAAALEMTAFVTQVDSELRALSEAAPQ